MNETDFFAFEAGRRGKPDEFDSILANNLVAYALRKNPYYKLNIRVNGQANAGKPFVELSGEVSREFLEETSDADLCKVVHEVYNNVTRTNISLSDIIIKNNLMPQSDALASNARKHRNGDSGETLAVALRNSPLYLPDERFMAVELRNVFDNIFFMNGVLPDTIAAYTKVKNVPGLRADGKISVRALFRNNVLEEVQGVTVALHHQELDFTEFKSATKDVVNGFINYLEHEVYHKNLGHPKIIVNGAGPWNGKGGWDADKGHNEAKPHRDWFGMRGVGEDSGSGENANKMSLLGTVLARYLAVQVVAFDLAPYAKVSLTYDIGGDGIADIFVGTNTTARVSQHELASFAKKFLPSSLDETISLFRLDKPETYDLFAKNADFFHDQSYVWNQKQE
jgi:S-adenosylmethionine synthetase